MQKQVQIRPQLKLSAQFPRLHAFIAQKKMHRFPTLKRLVAIVDEIVKRRRRSKRHEQEEKPRGRQLVFSVASLFRFFFSSRWYLFCHRRRFISSSSSRGHRCFRKPTNCIYKTWVESNEGAVCSLKRVSVYAEKRFEKRTPSQKRKKRNEGRSFFSLVSLSVSLCLSLVFGRKAKDFSPQSK